MKRSPHTSTACAAVVLVCVAFGVTASGQSPAKPLSILDVPFISQSEALCGGAAAAMVLRYWGARGLDAESFASLVDRSAGGIRTNRLVEDIRQRGWNAIEVDGREELVDAELARGRPVLALIEDRPGTFHYIVIVAATPQAIVLHDPARAPFRVMDREQFGRRWSRADRWMAVITPRETTPSSEPPAPVEAAAGSSCDDLIASGVQRAQAGQFDEAERKLTAALSCGGAAPVRELAGLRLLQRRFPEVGELASTAISLDPMDEYAWQLLATSRFVQNDPEGALEAWNRIEQPHVDLVSVGGLTHTRQRVVERLMAVPSQALLTPGLFDLTARRLKELPSATGTRVEFVPKSGVAELRAHVVERPLIPADRLSYAAIGLVAAARKEVALSTGALTGGGERISAGWRFWPERPRVNVEVVAPARWGGLWSVDGFAERQPFTNGTFPTTRRSGAGTGVSNWLTSWARVSARVGLDSWEDRGKYGVASVGARFASPHDRVTVGIDGSNWIGDDGFGLVAASARVRSSDANRGRVFIISGGGAAASRSTPGDLWFAGDTGNVRATLLRAHPVVDDGMLESDRLGRRIAHISGEARQWWAVKSLVHVGAAVFVDAARVERRAQPDGRADVDVGAGVRIGLPGLDGVFRVDLGKGLRDGRTALSFIYEP